MTERTPAGRMRPGSRTARVIALLIGLSYVVAGAWALVAPASFFASVATFAPYNEHLLHDVGAFQVGLGLALLLGVAARGALQPALLATLAASLLHVASHVEDRSLGGSPSDLLILGLFCALLAAGWSLERMATAPARGTAPERVGKEVR
jgi:uncharacterized membrane protein YphA (DoxX/SURF4 family)